MSDQCDWNKCKNEADISYTKDYNEKCKFMCDEHWKKFCNMSEEDKEDQAREKLGLKPYKKAEKKNENPNPV